MKDTHRIAALAASITADLEEQFDPDTPMALAMVLGMWCAEHGVQHSVVRDMQRIFWRTVLLAYTLRDESLHEDKSA